MCQAVCYKIGIAMLDDQRSIRGSALNNVFPAQPKRKTDAAELPLSAASVHICG